MPLRGLIAYGHDIVMAAASFLLSMYLRLGGDAFIHAREQLWPAVALFTAIAAVVFLLTGLYRGVWRYASLSDLVAITRAVTLVILVFLVFAFLWTRLGFLPRSIPLINWFALMALLGGPRFIYRISKDRRLDLRTDDAGRRRVPVLLAGADDGAELFIRALARAPERNYEVVGIVAEHRGRVGRHIHGVDILGTFDDLEPVVEALARRGRRPQRLVVTRDDLDGAIVRALLDRAARLGMTLARLPRLTDFKSGLADRVEVRPIALEDLLGRPQMPLDRDAMAALIGGRRVLVTGAGGSIGSELVRQISDFGPACLVLVDASEFNVYTIDMELSGRHPGLARRAVIADVRDRPHLERLIAETTPQLVFHAAALKHVPLVEANPLEGIRTNVLGTLNVAETCVAHGVETMVMVSTDKAVNPTSVMGATKRVAEQVCQALDLRRGGAGGGGTRFVTVRFGNVLGSTGSVVPLFQRQLAAGGPLTVTHPGVERYFMTIREAVELILQASALRHGTNERGGEPAPGGKIFVLDMGQPVKIVDLARQMIRLAGLEPDRDVKIEIIGLRPGEKLYEEVFHGGEALVETEAKGILLAAPRAVELEALRAKLDALAAACDAFDAGAALAELRGLVPEFRA